MSRIMNIKIRYPAFLIFGKTEALSGKSLIYQRLSEIGKY